MRVMKLGAAVPMTLFSFVAGAWAQADDAEKEVVKQTTRQISTAVVERAVATDTGSPGTISVWSTTSYNRINLRGGGTPNVGATPGTLTPAAPDFGVDLFQEIFGADTRLGSFVIGASGAVSYTVGNQDGIQSASPFGGSSSTGSIRQTGDSFSISPYLAYLLDQHVFFTGLVGYTRGTNWVRTGDSNFSFPGIPVQITPGTRSSSSTDTFFDDFAANVVYPVPDMPLTLGGRVGYRYQYSWLDSGDTPAGGSSSAGFGSNTFYTAVEARYTINAFTPYVRVQYEYNKPLTGTQPGIKENNNAVFLLAGFDYHVTPAFHAGLHFMTQQGNPSIENRQVAINLRMQF